jgi:Transport and Golgi organisation 2
MCTVSIVANGDGFRLVSNRDERRDRTVALHPRVERLGSRSVIMPIDPVGGGSWIGVDDAGLVAAVLNRYGGSPLPTRLFTSRGLIARQALGSDSIEMAVKSVLALDATRLQPFRLVLVKKGCIALVSGDGREFASAQSGLEHPYLFTASSLGDLFVDAPRRWLFECLMHHIDDRLDAQRLFHHHQWADKREISVQMEREDAATVSRTVVDVGKRGIALEYESLIPSHPARHVELQDC